MVKRFIVALSALTLLQGSALHAQEGEKMKQNDTWTLVHHRAGGTSRIWTEQETGTVHFRFTPVSPLHSSSGITFPRAEGVLTEQEAKHVQALSRAIVSDTSCHSTKSKHKGVSRLELTLSDKKTEVFAAGCASIVELNDLIVTWRQRHEVR